MPTDDIFDRAWGVAKGFRLPSSDDWDQMDERRKRGGPLPKTGKAKPEPQAEDVEKGFFSDFARKVKQKQREQEALNAYIVDNLIRHPDGLERGVQHHRRALEQMNRPPAPEPESIDEVRAVPPPIEPEVEESPEIQPETVRATPPRTGFTGGDEDAPKPPSPNQEAKLKNQEGYEEIERLLGRGEDKQASEAYSSVDDWTVVKDPFANPFFNPNFSDLTEEQPPEVTQDNTPTISLQPDLIKGDSPEDALRNAGFDARSGDDMSLLPSSAFDKEGEAPRGDTSLLPAGWDTE